MIVNFPRLLFLFYILVLRCYLFKRLWFGIVIIQVLWFPHCGNVCSCAMVWIIPSRRSRVVETITFKMATAQIVLLIEVLYFFEIFASGNSSRNASTIPCPYFRKTFPPLNVQGLVGNWRPIKAESHVTMICFNLNIRATTELVSIFWHIWRLRYTFPRSSYCRDV